VKSRTRRPANAVFIFPPVEPTCAIVGLDIE
jgi:hypothetical protein